ncbi:hypothetical protein C0993_007156 [Termitomyces sp. T159_Od127]|nr:hypothetical protein C0993_007156 [Termitomyces sp. T159_Od127]
MSSIFRKNSKSTNGSANGGTREKVSEGGVQAIRDFREQVKKGSLLSMDVSTLVGKSFDCVDLVSKDTSSKASVVDFIRNKEAIDDRKFFLEHGLTFISRLEPGKVQTALQNKIVELLYNDLGHPPATSISNKFAWRTADGSFNNPDLPDMGKAGTPYARSVQQSHPLPRNKLPDAGLVFDTLLKREGFVKHPAGLSSLMFSFAALVIHTVFRTSHHDWNINETSSYVDLSPLYGHDQTAQDSIRVRNGYGLLKPDVFAEDRLLLLPPAVCTLLVLFNRNHNYIAKKLYDINERGTFVDPTKLKTDNPEDFRKLLEQEEELFQTARLVNCGCVEDERWVGQVFNQIFDGKSPETVTVQDFKYAAHRIAATKPDVADWTFGGLKRQADHSFNDDDLANVLHNA